MDNKLKLNKYDKYLDVSTKTVLALTVLLTALLSFVWIFYVPKTKKSALKINFEDQRDPSKFNPPSTTAQNLSQKMVTNTNVQSSNDKHSQSNNLGNYQKAQLKQFCSNNDNSSAINLPSEYKFQQCENGLKCVSNILKNGPICLADIGSNCNNLSDCVPGADACIDNKCTTINVDNKINIACQNDTDCQFDQFEDQIGNHICINGFCKVDIFPGDGGCNINSDCPQVAGRDIKCVKTNTFKETLFTANIISINSGGLSVNLDVDFSLIFLNNSVIYLILDNQSLINFSGNYFPYTIPQSGVCDTTKNILLEELEFFGPYPSNYTVGQGLSTTFGDYPGVNSFTGSNNGSLSRTAGSLGGERDKDDGGLYGICLELLPLGSPSDLKIGGVSIPGVLTTPTTSLDGKIIRTSRTGKGKLNDFCMTNQTGNLGCGKTTYFGQIYQMECGYNYEYEEIVLDNLYYSLKPEPFQIELLGSCMIKNTPLNDICNNSTKGCIEPLICLPVSDPISKILQNFCVVPLRSQVCEANVCPQGYTCGTGNFCFSQSDSLAYLNSDCSSGVASNSRKFDLFVYNPIADKYFRLNLDKDFYNNLNNSDNLQNITFKLGTSYQTVNDYSQIGLENKTILPKDLLVYGTSQADGSVKGILFSLQNDSYKANKNFDITPASENSIYDINLTEDKIAVVQKKTITSLRNITLKVNNIENNAIVLENDPNWFNFNLFREGQSYDYYLYSTEGNYNTKGVGIFNLAKDILQGSLSDYFEDSSYSLTDYYSTATQEEVFITINSNKLAFNNNLYFQNFFNSAYKNDYVLQNPVYPNEGGISVLLPKGFVNSDINVYGENFFMVPKIYRNNSTVLSPSYLNNYTPLQNGDRIITDQELDFFNVKAFEDAEEFFEKITVPTETYLYPEIIQENYYFTSDNDPVFLNNYICNIHNDFLSSEGSVPIYGSSAVYNQNFGQSPGAVNFQIYNDMVNYNINFINIGDLNTSSNDIIIDSSNNFIGVSNNGNFIIPNGINNSFSYNFENEASLDFKYYSEGTSNYILITSEVQGLSSVHNYVQKIEYDLGISSSEDLDYTYFDLDNETTYQNFYQSSYTINTTGKLNNIKIKYNNKVIAPKPKSFYFDSSNTSNPINNVEENLFSTDENSITLFSTFKNDEFITDQISDISNKNIYSNRSPPVASYSRLDDFVIENSNGDINVDFGNINTNNNYVEIQNGISIFYSIDNNCVNNDRNLITIRDKEIIDVFLSNPASEILLQKNGDSLEDFYINGVSGIKYGAQVSSKEIVNQELEKVYTVNQWFDNAPDLESFTVNYINGVSGSRILQNNNLEINRSVVSIEEYNVYLDKNNNVNEYMIIKLNAPILNDDNYTINCFNNSSKWKLWHNNFAQITYYPSTDLTAYTNQNKIDVEYLLNSVENNICIPDSSPLWVSCKNTDSVLPDSFTKSSFNKLVFNDGTNFSSFNIHDNYFYKKENKIAELVQTNTATFGMTNITNTNNFLDNSDEDFLETYLNIDYVSGNVIGLPGNVDDIILFPGFEIPQSQENQPIPFDNKLIFGISGEESYSILPGLTGIRPVGWNGNFANNNTQSGIEGFIPDYINFKSIPKKVKLFDLTNNLTILYEYLGAPGGSSESYFGSLNNQNLSNSSFVYFKRNYIKQPVVSDFSVVNANPSAIGTLTTAFGSIMNMNILNITGNNSNDKILSINDYEEFFKGNDLAQTKISANTRTSNPSFKQTYIDYNNSFSPTVFTILGEPWQVLSNNYTLDGYYDLAFFCFYNYQPAGVKSTIVYNIISKLEMRPVNSGNIALPDQFSNYEQNLYMINNLFLSTLPRQISNFKYLNLNILDDFIISNLYYTNYNSSVSKNYKSLGLIQFGINGAPIFDNNNANINKFNLVNYEEIRFPEYFTERFVSRLNAIPQIKSIFTTIGQGNIYDNMIYYAYINYDSVEGASNNQFLYMTTDSDQENYLNNKGVPYTVSLNENQISSSQLDRTVKMEPYNKLLITAGYFCT